ncbi:ABC transporter permease [Hansschlegelia sp.]|uniref:ABC transporter permease n=1 Tax=Hansschlegelia sp. TaxID=2041892 RepID=UPI002D0C4E88|nr:ABC transporter permease [Hansschlegelia sp.]HVI29912.1 ABC transporter permease [Hansschlegelia sp.]
MNIAASAKLQARVVFALIVQRIRTQHAGSRAGYIWAILEPIIWIFVLKFAIRGKDNNHPPIGTSYEVFYATGVVIARGWRTTSQSVARAVRKRTKSALLFRIDAAYAAWLLNTATSAVAMLLILFILGLFGYDVMPNSPLICIAAFLAAALFSFGFGLMLALLLTAAPGISHFQHIIMLVIFITSGFSMIIDRVAPQLRQVLLWNPLVHCIEWFREGFYKGYVCANLDLFYLFSVSITFILCGLAGERVTRHHFNRAPIR